MKNNFTFLHTVGDGSCLIHAVLQAFNKEYKNLTNDSQKSKLVKEVRYHLSQVLEIKFPDEKNLYQKLSRGELENISKEIPEASLNYMKKYLNSNNFLTLQYIEILSEIFNVNIIFFSREKENFYQHGDNELLFKKNRDTIFINYIQDTHYETISINRKTLFKPGDNIVKKALKKLLYKG